MPPVTSHKIAPQKPLTSNHSQVVVASSSTAVVTVTISLTTVVVVVVVVVVLKRLLSRSPVLVAIAINFMVVTVDRLE